MANQQIVNHQITQILKALSVDDPQYRTMLFSALYDDLHRIAQGQMRRESAGHTLQGTALVHETFLKLMQLKECQWANRRHFFNTAAEVMRHILIDHARNRSRQKRGGQLQRVALATDQIETNAPSQNSPDDLLELHCALEEFERLSPEKAELVKLRFFPD